MEIAPTIIYNHISLSIFGNERRKSVGELPSHGHSGSTNSAGNHSHSFYGISTPTQADNPGIGAALHASATGWTQNNRISTAGAHSHTVSIGNAGGDTAHNNMPPYLAVHIWKRTA